MATGYSGTFSKYQRTISKAVTCTGVGLHSGLPVTLRLRPSLANSGIQLKRTDIAGTPTIPVLATSIVSTQLATTIGISKEISVSTVEHLLGAVFAFGIDNLIIEVNSNEIPIMDGSSAPFLVMLDEAGVHTLESPKKVFIVKKPVEVCDPKDPSAFVRVEPSATPWLSYSIDFEKTPCIGYQAFSMPLTGEAFCTEVSMARTFCHSKDVEYMRSVGLAKGGDLNNAIVVGDNGNILNPNGLRTPQEFVKHKALDCIGDLALLGMPLVGHVLASKAGHTLHTQLVKALLDDALSHTILELCETQQPIPLISNIVEKLKFPTSLVGLKPAV